MITIKSCKVCGKLFDDIVGSGICPECRYSNENVDVETQNQSVSRKRLHANLKTKEDKELKKFEELKEYVLTHSHATIMEISTALKISPTLILNWIREERIEFSDESKDAWFDCEKCGVKIKSGRYCMSCKLKINS